ncbi:MAG: response regulator transcription factor [Bdellovibrionaceae bacterium]|nr:response regulator transcription factor [Pseudobdellovibrionaceae bacterium]
MILPSILVVEDTSEHFELIATSLGEGYQLDLAPTMAEALKKIEARDYDLVLLDIMLPDGDGYQICTQLKANARTKNVPIIFLSSKKEVTDKVIGFTLGAEDYIVKPCAPPELKARVDSKLRKRTRTEVAAFHGLHINFLNQKVKIENDDRTQEEVDLTPREYKLLAYLARHREVALSREQILKAVWGENMHVSDRSIDTHIAAIRKKLGAYSHYIRSVHGTGYRFSPTSPRSKQTA